MAITKGKLRLYVRDAKGRFATTGGSKQLDALHEFAKHAGTMGDVTNPLIVMGIEYSQRKVTEYLKKNGAIETLGSSLPPGMKMGKMGQCYTNASRLVMDNPHLNYAEGYAIPKGHSGIAYLHGWAVDKKTGNVVDPTWKDSENTKYYGVVYPQRKYLDYIIKTKMYGVLGGDYKSGLKVLEKGGL